MKQIAHYLVTAAIAFTFGLAGALAVAVFQFGLLTGVAAEWAAAIATLGAVIVALLAPARRAARPTETSTTGGHPGRLQSHRLFRRAAPPRERDDGGREMVRGRKRILSPASAALSRYI